MKDRIAILILVALISSCGIKTKKKKERPNVVLIVVDDLGYADMGCTGLSNDVKTPNLDQLASSGARFTNAYATSPICNPSRVGIITGTYQQKLGCGWYGGPGIENTRFPTIAEILKEAGYATAYIGKVHYGSHDHDTDGRNFPLNHGFDYFVGHTSARKHYLNHRQTVEDEFNELKAHYERKGQSLRQQPLWNNDQMLDTAVFTTTYFAELATQYIEQHLGKPFFIQLSFNAVHNFSHQLPEEYLKANNLIGYHDWDPATEDYYQWYKKGRFPNNPEGRAHYLGQLHYLDQAIGQVVNQLEKLDIRKNTLVILISDNGGSTPIYANNFPLSGSKYVLKEGGIRVSMLASFPGVVKGDKVVNETVSALDILPTICHYVGKDIPATVDGINLEGVLKNESDGHDTLYWHTGVESAIRVGDWKYHRVIDDSHAKYEMVELAKGEFLYNLNEDITETNNLIDSHADKALLLKQALQKWIENTGYKAELPDYSK